MKRVINNLIVGSTVMLILFIYSSPGEFQIKLDPMMKKAGTPPLRQLSIDNGDGTCKWQPPAYSVPEDIEFHKTIITGFPRWEEKYLWLYIWFHNNVEYESRLLCSALYTCNLQECEVTLSILSAVLRTTEDFSGVIKLLPLFVDISILVHHFPAFFQMPSNIIFLLDFIDFMQWRQKVDIRSIGSSDRVECKGWMGFSIFGNVQSSIY